MNMPMEENAPSSPSDFAEPKKGLFGPRALLYAALSLALGAAAVGAGWRFHLKPLMAAERNRRQAELSLLRLYTLQEDYRNAHGTYANDLDAILAWAPDGAQLREKLKACVDLDTVAVIGDAKRFRLEINVLDPERTSVKIRGPVGER